MESSSPIRIPMGRLPDAHTQPGPDAESRALATPFRVILLAIAVTAVLAQLIDAWVGEYWRIVFTIPVLAVLAIAWRIGERGSIARAALLVFYMGAIVLTARLWTGGHGLRDFSVAAYPTLLFFGCVFIPGKAAYWGLAAFVLACVGITGGLEVAGLRGPGLYPLELPRLVNLLVILAASAAGGRALTMTVRRAFDRERTLSGALRTSEERIEKVFRASHGAIVVSSLEDGTYLEVNDAYLALFGHDRADVIGRTALELGVWDDPHDRDLFLREVRRQGSVRDFPARMRNRAGEALETLLSAERIEMERESWLLVSVADVTALHRAESRAEFLATRDPLTGLATRAAALDRLRQAIGRAQADGHRLALLRVGIDRLKGINESLGHEAGDAVVREAAHRLEALQRPGHALARMGGDEFLMLLDPLLDSAEAITSAHRVLESFIPPFVVGDRELRVSCSVGLCAYPDDGNDAGTLLSYADTALRAAKEAGRDRICAFDPSMTERAMRRMLLENDLRDALRRGELRLEYQPKVRLGDGTIAGLEALARWRHGERGFIAPAQFIAIAEESDLILELGEWAVDEACAQLARWKAEGHRPVPVAVNLSAVQLDASFPAFVEDALRRHGVAPALLEFEVTESMLIAHPESTRRVLQRLVARGSGVVLDDFGVGYSSLNYVKHLPLTGIKVDRSFVSAIESDARDAAIVKAIVGLAHGLDFRVIAEGIESEAQSAALRAIGCDEGQGYHYSKPLPPEELASRWLVQRSREPVLPA